jgi:hypothetical protein
MAYLITIGLAVLIGAISAVAAWSVTRGLQRKQPVFSILLFLFFLILGTCSKLFVLPHILEWRYSEDIDRALSQIAVYQHIAKYDPKAYQEIKRELTTSIKNRETQDEAIDRVRSRVAELVAAYIPRASDDAILRYMRAIVKEMQELSGKNPELCYQFLFPQKYGGADVTDHLMPETKREDLVALGEVIRTAVKEPQPLPDPAAAETLLKRTLSQFSRDHGEDTLLLKDPFAPGIDKGRACGLIASLYEEVLNLPERESSLVLRYMLSTRK